MANYEWECTKCGQHMERLLPMDAVKPDTCGCGGHLKQCYGTFAIFMGKAPLSFYRKFAGPHTDARKP